MGQNRTKTGEDRWDRTGLRQNKIVGTGKDTWDRTGRRPFRLGGTEQCRKTKTIQDKRSETGQNKTEKSAERIGEVGSRTVQN